MNKFLVRREELGVRSLRGGLRRNFENSLTTDIQNLCAAAHTKNS